MRKIVIFALIVALGAFATNNSPANAQAISLATGEDVHPKTREAIEDSFGDIIDFYAKTFGYRLKGPARAYASAQPEFIGRAFVRERPGASLSHATKLWTNEREAETGYQHFFMKTNTGAFQGRARPKKGPLRYMLSHEVFHLIQYELVGSKAARCCNQDRVPVVGPTWLHEGAADYAMHVYASKRLGNGLSGAMSRLRRSARQFEGSLADIEYGAKFYPTPKAYDIGAYATHLLVERAGPGSVLQFYANLRRTNNWKAAFASAFGLSVEEFYSEFQSI